MKVTPLIFCGFLLTVAGCNPSDNNAEKTETSKESAVSTEVNSPPTENNQALVSEESPVDIPVEPVENQAVEDEKPELLPVVEEVKEEVQTDSSTESIENQPVAEEENPEPAPVEEVKTEIPTESVENQPVEEEKSEPVSESAPTESAPVTTPAEQVVDEHKIEENQVAMAGKKLHDEQCVVCHANRTRGDSTALYTREDRKVKDLKGLQGQVERCVTVLNVEWFDDEIDSVVEYLNTDFYKFTAASNQ